MAGHTTLVMLISLWAVMELKLEFHWGPQNTSHKMKKRHTQNTKHRTQTTPRTVGPGKLIKPLIWMI